MKKLLCSVIAMIAFTATSFASEVSKSETFVDKTKATEISLASVNENLKDDGCTTERISVITCVEVSLSPTGEYAVNIEYALYDVTVCSDGSNSSFTMTRV